MADPGAGGENENNQGHRVGVAFQIDIDEEGERRPRSALPERFRNYKKKTVTKEELDQKQIEAESRRKEKEKEMLKRIHQAQEDVAKLNQNFSVLLKADAQRHRTEGTSDTALSRLELKEKFQGCE